MQSNHSFLLLGKHLCIRTKDTYDILQGIASASELGLESHCARSCTTLKRSSVTQEPKEGKDGSREEEWEVGVIFGRQIS